MEATRQTKKIKSTGKFFDVKDVRIDEKHLSIRIDGTDYSFPLKNISSRLLKASKQERQTFTIDKYGYGIHWSSIDEDLSVKGLVEQAVKKISRTQSLSSL